MWRLRRGVVFVSTSTTFTYVCSNSPQHGLSWRLGLETGEAEPARCNTEHLRSPTYTAKLPWPPQLR